MKAPTHIVIEETPESRLREANKRIMDLEYALSTMTDSETNTSYDRMVSALEGHQRPDVALLWARNTFTQEFLSKYTIEIRMLYCKALVDFCVKHLYPAEKHWKSNV